MLNAELKNAPGSIYINKL